MRLRAENCTETGTCLDFLQWELSKKFERFSLPVLDNDWRVWYSNHCRQLPVWWNW